MKSTSKRSDINNGDVIVIRNQMMLVEMQCNDDSMEVLTVEKEERGALYPSDLKLGFKNLGQSAAVIASFYAARSIHLRLNRIKP